MADAFYARNTEYNQQPHSAWLWYVMQQNYLMYAVHAERGRLTAKEGQRPFIHVARAQSSNTLGPQASCTPADRGRVCNNADVHSIYLYEVWDAWDAWDA